MKGGGVIGDVGGLLGEGIKPGCEPATILFCCFYEEFVSTMSYKFLKEIYFNEV